MSEEDPMAIQINLCQLCGGDADGFTDEVSRREYALTGACARCQDEVLGGPLRPEGDGGESLA